MTAASALGRLARLYHVQTAYTNIAGRRRRAPSESLMPVLRALGAPITTLADAPDALRRRKAELTGALLPPVLVVHGTRGAATVLSAGRQTIAMELIREDGSALRWTIRGGEPGRSVAVPLPALPYGYHSLRAIQGSASSTSMVVAAPVRAFGGPPEKTWGVFLPLYAVRTAGSWGAGNFSDLPDLAAWVGGLGGSVVATLPLLPVFLDMPFDPSPYAPISRRFWNEFYVDVERIPDLAAVPAARALIASADFQRDLRRQRRAPLVDYAPQMRQKRAVLEVLARALVSGSGPRREQFERFARSRPAAADYAAFRAVMERQGRSWTDWPSRLRDGTLRRGDFDESSQQYHLYAQWIAHEQFAAASKAVHQAGGLVYLDLPLGVHAWGYDAWRDREVFAAGVSTGAPPDTFFAQGQNWGTRPLHPDRLRATGYQYFIACIRHHLAHANVLRIDHVMGLHRFFWIPDGFGAADGVYVRYPAEEFYAILTLESMRHQAMIVGENLGTVPAYVSQAMQRHGVLQTYVVQYALQPSASTPLAPAPADAVASLNTHDMPTFAAWWTGRELRDLRALGHLSAEQASTEWRRRVTMLRALVRLLRRRRLLRPPVTARRMLHALLAHLGEGPARVVLVNLEDLWLETRPQNVPGTAAQRPNWRRKAALTLAQLRRMGPITGVLRDLDRRRRSV